jgi:hypothetical protein
MLDRPCIRREDKAASRLAPKGDDGCFDLCVAMNGRNDLLDLRLDSYVGGTCTRWNGS